MRRLKPPTLMQWGCLHRWKEQSSKPQGDKLHRLRYYFCQRCGLRAKTREVPEVPWDESAVLTEVRRLLPEGQPVNLRDHGIAELPLQGLNRLLARQGFVIHAAKARDPKWSVACRDQDGHAKSFGVFELRQLASGKAARPTRRKREG
jgi:hypothetical protein